MLDNRFGEVLFMFCNNQVINRILISCMKVNFLFSKAFTRIHF